MRIAVKVPWEEKCQISLVLSDPTYWESLGINKDIDLSWKVSTRIYPGDTPCCLVARKLLSGRYRTCHQLSMEFLLMRNKPLKLAKITQMKCQSAVAPHTGHALRDGEGGCSIWKHDANEQTEANEVKDFYWKEQRWNEQWESIMKRLVQWKKIRPKEVMGGGLIHFGVFVQVPSCFLFSHSSHLWFLQDKKRVPCRGQ